MSVASALPISVLSLLLLAPSLQAMDATDVVRQSRYVSQQVGPTLAQTDVMQSVVRVSIPEQILSVGAALQYLLKPYGYQLDDAMDDSESLAVYVLLTRTLPEPHRTLDAMTLHDALDVLGGASFETVINPVLRTVRYRLKPGFLEYVSDSYGEEARVIWMAAADSSSSAVPVTPFSTTVAGSIEGADYGPVKPGDTLGGIVLDLGLKGMTLAQALVHVFHANPDAFANHNMNHLLVGAYLTVPPLSDAPLTPTAASRLVDEHYRRWLQQVQP